LRQPIETGIFKPKASQSETKNDVTTRAARDIIHKEAAARIEKTARLRAARQAKEITDEPLPPVKKPAARKKAASKR
jgi:hypothetical protein